MKKVLVIILILQLENALAQKFPGIIGRKNTIGISFDAGVFRLSRFTVKRLFIPAIQYTRVFSRHNSFTCEFQFFHIEIKDNNEGRNDRRLKYSEAYNYDAISTGRGQVSALVFAAYRTSNWLGFGPVGAYHSWGVHAASITYASDNFTYNKNSYIPYGPNTVSNGPGKPSSLVFSLSIGFGRKKTIFKSNRVIWDYGIKCRIPFIGANSINHKYYDGREYLVYHGVKSYIGSTFLMLHTGFHFAF